MTRRLVALVAVLAVALFATGFALAKPQAEPGSGAGSDAAPQELAIDRVDVQAGLASGAPAALHAPPPVRRRRSRPRPAPAATTPRSVIPVKRPRLVATPRPQVVSTPAPVARPIVTPAPPAPKPRPAPTPKPPSYVGSGFDDSG
jgi:hypothetical protein